MVASWQKEARNAQVKEILELIYKLLVFSLIELLTAVVANEDRPRKRAYEAADAENGIHGLTTVTVHRIGEIVELKDTEPDSC